ncbi:glycosyltransferase family 2 protein [Flavivirga sp. 57AJ16]|uniref:glycosyltransferase family 2 protein n=1 Tax=Flavivirga sp. 57AJ16 TaxID=3025307 RepID=UPI002366F36B|nr:glycosyltransferase family 2 protein [Flavivirga sp. 57AJ16]MDD7885215.1 glycosyltransferase family 2 protein [Flavivirga sp. 57AJ16]
MKLSIVILNYNVRYFLELCLKSVQAATLEIDAEIIVVDNNSEDDSCQMVRTLFPGIKLIENKTNFGFSKGNNMGVLQAKGEYICILNPDTVVAEDTFSKLLNFSEKKEKLGIVGCKLINGAGVFLPESKRNIPYVKVAVKKIYGNSKDYYANDLQANALGKVDILVGAFMLLKRDVYNAIGGFDEDYFMYGEDIDLSYRVLKAGYNNYYYGASSIIHFKGESTLKDKFYARRFYGAMQIFYKKHFTKNILFDMLVWLGIRLVYVFREIPVKRQKKTSQYIFISDVANEKLKTILPKTVIFKQKLDSVEKKAEIIFDANSYSYKSIIKMIEDNKDQAITFKILPKNSNFVLGSDDAISRGEVISL